ncbi:MAG TPA: PASTA domain-containing protein [Gaiellaceae bacterium]
MALLIVPFAFIAPGCAEEREHPAPAANPPVVTVPDLVGDNLDSAEERLDALGIGYDVDSGDDTVFVEHLWEVCYQEPDGGSQARYVTLTVEHDCDDGD